MSFQYSIISKLWVRYLLVVTNLLTIQSAFSQDALNELSVDRPGVADKPFTVPKGTYQFELGFDYFNRSNGQLYNLPTGLFRTGISKRSELRIGTKQVIDRTDANSFNVVSPVSVGFKMHIIQQNKRVPEVDIAANMIIPTGKSTNYSNSLGYEVLLLFQNDFYPNTALNYNVGFIWDAIKGKPVFTASVCFDYLPTPKLGLFAEYFSFVLNRWPGEQGFDGGMTYLVSPKIQIDLSAGVSRQSQKTNLFVSSGLTFRIH